MVYNVPLKIVRLFWKISSLLAYSIWQAFEPVELEMLAPCKVLPIYETTNILLRDVYTQSYDSSVFHLWWHMIHMSP